MFHANAWGLAFSAPAVGAKLVMPGANLDPAVLAETIELEEVTFTTGVPTVMQGLIDHYRARRAGYAQAGHHRRRSVSSGDRDRRCRA
jgi:fatty-acyl-CoA synthase